MATTNCRRLWVAAIETEKKRERESWEGGRNREREKAERGRHRESEAGRRGDIETKAEKETETERESWRWKAKPIFALNYEKANKLFEGCPGVCLHVCVCGRVCVQYPVHFRWFNTPSPLSPAVDVWHNNDATRLYNIISSPRPFWCRRQLL